MSAAMPGKKAGIIGLSRQANIRRQGYVVTHVIGVGLATIILPLLLRFVV